MNKRDQVIETALKLFINQGFHSTPTAQISKESGVATGTLFHHFKNKEELINAIYREKKEMLKNALIKDFPYELGTKQMIKEAFFRMINHGMDHPETHRFFLLFSNSPFITSFSKEEADRGFSFFYELIQKGISEGIVKNIDQTLLMETLAGHTHSFMNYLWQNPVKSNENESYNLGFQLLWDAIKE